MFSTEGLQIVGGISGVIGLLALLAYLYAALNLRAVETAKLTSAREAVEGAGIFNADQVIDILKQFTTEEARLGALRELAKVQRRSQETADKVYGKVKGAIDLVEMQSRQVTHRNKLLRNVALFFFLVSLAAIAYTAIDFARERRADHEAMEKEIAKAATDRRNFQLGNLDARDGQGNVVGSVGSLNVTGSPSGTGSRVFVTYGFYNGSGTWRGSQNIVLTFLGKNKSGLGQLTIPIDRGKCVYGQAETRSFEGALNVKPSDIENIEAMITRVTGTQTRC